MSDTGSVGSAFVEVHARAAASLEREMQQSVNTAAAKVQPPPQSRNAFGGGSASFESSQTPEKQAAAAALQERIAKRRAAAEEEVAKKVKVTGDTAERANVKAAASGNTWSSSLARTAAAVAVVDVATRAVVGAITAFLKAGDEGRLKSAEDLRAYREMANGLDDLSEAWDRAKLAAGRFIAQNVNPFSADFQKGVIAFNNPLDALSVALGRTSSGTRDLAKQFAAIDAQEPGETIAERKRQVDALAESSAKAAKELDARTEAAVRAVGIEFEQIGSNERLWKAQEKVNETRERGARTARELADAERAIREARQQAADAAQNALERDRAVEEARRKFRDTAFRMGSGAQATLDAADEVTEAEFKAKRAHEEAGDAVADVARAEQDAASVRTKAVQDQAEAESDLQDAQRNSAKTSADLKVATREAAGETVTATQKLSIYLEELGKFDGKGGKVKAEIDIITKALESLLPARTTAEQAIAAIQAALAPGGGFAEPAAAAPPISPVPQQLNLGPGMGSVTVYQTFNNQANPQVVAADTAWLLQETAAPLTKIGQPS